MRETNTHSLLWLMQIVSVPPGQKRSTFSFSACAPSTWCLHVASLWSVQHSGGSHLLFLSLPPREAQTSQSASFTKTARMPARSPPTHKQESMQTHTRTHTKRNVIFLCRTAAVRPHMTGLGDWEKRLQSSSRRKNSISIWKYTAVWPNKRTQAADLVQCITIKLILCCFLNHSCLFWSSKWQNMTVTLSALA